MHAATRLTGITIVVAGMLVVATSPLWAGASVQQKCQSGKNKAAGKYATCRQSAEAKLATAPLDTVKYNDALAKCQTKFASAWQKEIEKATSAGVSCLDAPLTELNFETAINGQTTTLATALGGGGLVDYPAALANCNGSLGTCNGSLGTCNGSLGTCNTNLASCNTTLTTCNTNYTWNSSSCVAATRTFTCAAKPATGT
jgi:hypothetical protein